MTAELTVVTARAALVGENLDVITDARIEIDGEDIVAISSSGDGDDKNAIDAGDVTLVPGFIDAHVHIGFHRPIDVLRGGVTTVRDLGWPPEDAFAMAERSQTQDFAGPTIHAVGPILTCPGGYPTRAAWAPAGTGLAVTSAAHARAAVAELCERGARQIKIALEPAVGPVLDDPELSAIVETAHELARPVTSHTRGMDQLERALAAGVDELAHTLFTDEPIPRRAIERMVGAGMAVVPTLSIFSGRERRIAIESTRRFYDSGGTILYGTDLGNNGPRPGIDRREIKAMADAGMSSLDIIRAATVTPARRLGFSRIGSLEPGTHADIVGLGGDPLASPKDLTDVRFVMRRGVRAL